MKHLGKNLAEAAAFAIVMTIVAWYDGSIVPDGGAEPCPFSPYSDVNVRDTSLREAMNSGLFRALRDNGHLLEDHVGGCVLYEKRGLVEQLLRESAGA